MSDIANPIRAAARAATASLVFVAIAGLSACAGPNAPFAAFGPGERVAYHVWNDTGNDIIERPELHALGDGQVLYANLQAYAPGWRLPRPGQEARAPVSTPDGDELLALPRPMDGAFALAPIGHRVPWRVRLSWRKPAAPGQVLYGGTPMPPIEFDLREQIPPAVLSQAAEGWRHRLDIAIGARPGSPTVRWRLMRHGDEGTFELRRSAGW
ncbi:MAG: hypothetical protein R3E87_18970 [Burkholderiaceae bacterium]